MYWYGISTKFSAHHLTTPSLLLQSLILLNLFTLYRALKVEHEQIAKALAHRTVNPITQGPDFNSCPWQHFFYLFVTQFFDMLAINNDYIYSAKCAHIDKICMQNETLTIWLCHKVYFNACFSFVHRYTLHHIAKN